MMANTGDIPNWVKESVPDDVILAIERLHQLGVEEFEAYYQHETGEFVGLGFIGPGGKFTRPANPEALAALEIVEQQYIKELGMMRGCVQTC